MERTVAIIQARMASERLPGKVLLDIAGQTMLERVIRRVRGARRVDEIVVATSVNPLDDAVVAACTAFDATVFRGSEDDVLDRFHSAARAFGARVCVRVSADSPFVDPEVCDQVIAALATSNPPADYASNKLRPSFPLGLDVEAFTAVALERAWHKAREAYERAHVTPYIYGHPEEFRLTAVETDVNRHNWRWTVDSREDLEFARAMFERLGGGNDFSWRDAVAVVNREPALAEINALSMQKDVTAG